MVNKTIEITESGRLDKVLATRIDFSRSKIQQLISQGKVFVEGQKCTNKSKVIDNKTIQLKYSPMKRSDSIHPENKPLEILYEDEYILAVYKPSGLLVHPTSSQNSNTLVNRLIYEYPELTEVGEPHRAGLANRLDKGTSGVLLVARNTDILNHLKKQFKERSIEKKYLAIANGILDEDKIKIEVPIKRDSSNPTLREAHPEGKQSITVIRKQGYSEGKSALLCFPKTGRTHQLRIHCKYLGHPILGDQKYRGDNYSRLMLHSSSIQFTHPRTGERIKVESEPPEEVEQLWRKIV